MNNPSNILSVGDLLNSLESFTLYCAVHKESCVEKTVEDPTGSHNSGKNIIIRHTIPVYQDAEEDVTDAGVERSPLKNRKNLTKNRLDSSIASNSSICSSSTNVTANSRLISSFSTILLGFAMISPLKREQAMQVQDHVTL